MHTCARSTAEDQLGGQTVGVRRLLHLFRHAMALFALEWAPVCPAAQVRLVSAHADGRDRVVAQGIEGWGRVLIAAVAGLAVTGGVVDDAVHVALGGDEMARRVDHVGVAGVAAVRLWMKGLRRQAVASATRSAAVARLAPHRPRFAMAIAALTSPGSGIVGRRAFARLGERSEFHVARWSVVGVARRIDRARDD